jgi:hypothetical protein
LTDPEKSNCFFHQLFQLASTSETSHTACLVLRSILSTHIVQSPHLSQRFIFELWNSQKVLKLLRHLNLTTLEYSDAFAQSTASLDHLVSTFLSEMDIAQAFGFDPFVHGPIEYLENGPGMLKSSQLSTLPGLGSQIFNSLPSPALRWSLALVTVFVCDELGQVGHIGVDLWDLLQWYPHLTQHPTFLSTVEGQSLPFDNQSHTSKKETQVHFVYMVSHLMYALTAFSPSASIDPSLLPLEFHFLTNALSAFTAEGLKYDAAGEALDCLKIFLRHDVSSKARSGRTKLSETHAFNPFTVSLPDIQRALNTVQQAQLWLQEGENADGSWGGSCEHQQHEACVSGDAIHTSFAVMWGLSASMEPPLVSKVGPGIVFKDVANVLKDYPSFHGYEFPELKG